jgi:hypothetical protein
MSSKDRLTTAQWVLERTLGWIAAAEIKVGVVVTIDIAMMGGLAAAYSTATSRTQWAYGSTVVSAALAVVAMACAAMSVKPRLDGPNHSLLYFGRVSAMPRADYIEKFRKVTDEDLLNDLTEQIHRNAEIAKIKHVWVTRAINWSFLSSISWAVAVALLVKA